MKKQLHFVLSLACLKLFAYLGVFVLVLAPDIAGANTAEFSVGAKAAEFSARVNTTEFAAKANEVEFSSKTETETETEYVVDTVYKLKEVQVYGDKKLPKGVSVQQMKTSELKVFNPQQIGEVIKGFSGVNVKDYGGIGGMKTVSVRSLGAAHTAVVYNGVVLSDAQNGQIDLSKLSLDRVETLSLYNASSGSLFSPARQFASASVLEITSDNAQLNENGYAIEASLTAGAFGLWSPYLSYDQRLAKNTRISARGRYTDVKGNYPYVLENGQASEKLQRENTDVHSGYAELRLQTEFNDKHSLEGSFHYDEGERGLPGAVIFYAPSSSQRLHERSTWVQLKHLVEYEKGFSQKSFLKYEYDYSRFLDPEALNSNGMVDDRYHKQEIYASTVGLYRIPSYRQWSFSAALDGAYSFLNANLFDFIYPHRTSIWFNLAGRYSIKWVEIEANMLNSAYIEGVQKGEKPQNKFRVSPTVSLAIFPLAKPIWAIRVFYKDIFRMPTFNDLYYDRVGNTALKPEKAKQLDVGSTFVFESKENEGLKIEISGDLYRNWVEDKIVAFPTKNLFIWSMMNVGKVDTYGANISVQGNFPFAKMGLLSKFALSLRAAYTHERSLDKTDPSDVFYGQQIVYTPVNSGSGLLSLKMPYVSLSYGLNWSGERYCLPENVEVNRLKPYVDQSVSVQVSWKMLKGEWEMGLNYLNVVNVSYEIVRYYPMPGSQWRLSIKCRY